MLFACSDLELENDRLRVFYTRKIEDLQRKADVQMRAMKRGVGLNSAISAAAGGGGGDVDFDYDDDTRRLDVDAEGNVE